MRRPKHPIRIILLWALALVWIAVLFFFSAQTAEESGSLSMWATEVLLRLCPWIPLDAAVLHPIIRKLAHFCFFGIEGFLLGLASLNTFRGRFSVGMPVVACAAMAALNEYRQMFAEGRSCEVRDMLIDFSGAVLGIVLAALIFAACTRAKRDERKN